MSEQAPERVPPANARVGGNVFTQKLGPLPMWAWIAIAAGILIVWRIYASKQSAAAQQSTAATSTSDSQVPQFVNQTYLTTTPPTVSPSTSTTPSPTTPTPPGQPGPTTPMPTTATTPQQISRTIANALASVTGLRTSGVGATNIGLAWNPAPGAQQYQVRVTYQGKVIKTAMTKGTQYNVTGLSPNRTYGLHVVAINGGDWAPEASITQKTT